MGEGTKTGLNLFSSVALLERKNESVEPIERRRLLMEQEMAIPTDLPVEGGVFRVNTRMEECYTKKPSQKNEVIGYNIGIEFPIYVAFERKFGPEENLKTAEFYNNMVRRLRAGEFKTRVTSEGLVSIVLEE